MEVREEDAINMSSTGGLGCEDEEHDTFEDKIA